MNKIIQSTVKTNWKQKGLSKIEGIITSPIKTRRDTNEPHNQWTTYHQAFFQLEGITTEIPVIFRVRCPGGNQVRPQISPRAKVLLTGQWAESSNSTRPSFTCSDYQILTNPPPPTIKSLQEQISQLLTTSLKKQSEWKQRVDYLFQQRKELQEIDQLTKLGDPYLQAHLLLRRAFYSNYQDNLLVHNQWNQQEYLTKLQGEIEEIAQCVRAYQAKETY